MVLPPRPAARTLAAQEGIEPDAEYWPVLHFMREYWMEQRVAPDVRHVVDYLVREQGEAKIHCLEHEM